MMPVPEKKMIEVNEDEYNELLEKLEFLKEENLKLREQNLKEEREREETRMAELDQFREAAIAWWRTIDETMKMYETALGNEHRLRHERQKLLKEIEDLRRQVGIVAVFDGPPKKDDDEKETEARPPRLDS
jgi:hypothetical protein